MSEFEYEQILLVKNEVFIFKIPPRTSNRAQRASDWNLDAPDWTGRLKLVAIGDKCVLKIEDKASGKLFAKCPIDVYPGVAIEAVSDSSRYFVIRVQNDDGRSAFIGMGFADRGDSFDLNVALQDHFKLVEKQSKLEQEDGADSQPKLDLKFKEGQTIKVNLNIAKKSGANSGKVRPKSNAATGILPPPPRSRASSDFPASSDLTCEKSTPVTMSTVSNISPNNVKPFTSISELDDFDSLSISRASQNYKPEPSKAATPTNSNISDLLNVLGDNTNLNSFSDNSQPEQSNWANF